jgi:Flp pilus assembly pilin Flp
MFKVLAFLTAPVRRDDRGVTAVEYALLLVFVAAVLAASLVVFGKDLAGVFNTIAGDF